MTMMTGIVEAVATKEVKTKFGMKPTFSLKVNGTWVKCGFKNPGANVGDEIQFDGESGTYGMEAKNVTITSKGSGAPAAVASSAPPRSVPARSEKVFPIPPLHGDRSIVRQNALARATEIMIASAGGKALAVNDEIISLTIAIARKFEAYTAGDLDLAEAQAEVAKGE